MNKKFESFSKHMERACDFLKWDYKVDENENDEETFNFTIGDFPYAVYEDAERMFGAIYFTLCHATYHEPESVDDHEIKGSPTVVPEFLVARILRCHFDSLLGIVQQDLSYMDMPNEETYE